MKTACGFGRKPFFFKTFDGNAAARLRTGLMPFTPFHMGPGCVVKAVLGRYFSLTVFGFAQVVIDLEPLVRMLRRDTTLHGISHTYLGATGVALVSLVVGRRVCQRLLDSWTPDPGAGLLTWLRGPRTISWPAALSGAVIGAYSHVLLDSIMHADMHPFWPFAEGNGLLGILSIENLHLVCAAAGVVGCVGLAGVYWLTGRPRDDAGRS
jgi:hypothetical protein